MELDTRDWVEFRTHYDNDSTLKEWVDNRSINSKFKDADQWLNQKNWKDLNSKIKELNKKDENNNDAIDFDSWMYFRSGFYDAKEKEDDKPVEIDSKISLKDAFVKHKSVVNEKQLNKYVDIFSIIGFILIGFSVLIALLRRPLNKLMHGVE